MTGLFADFRLYADRFVKIKKREGGGVIPMRLKPAQLAVDESIEAKHRQGQPAFELIVKARRIGMSTEASTRGFHRAATKRYQRVIVVAHRKEDAQTIFGMYERAWENLPDDVQPRRAGGRNQQMIFPELHSQIDVGSAQTADFGRGGDAQFLQLDEAAYYKAAEDVMAALMPMVPATGDATVLVLSTANGPGGWFHDLWERSLDGVSGFTPHFFPFFVEPDHRMPTALPEAEWTEEEREWSTRFGVDGHQLAWLRFRKEVDCFGRDDRRRREYPFTPEEAFSSVGDVAWSEQDLFGCFQRMEPKFRAVLTDDGLERVPEGDLIIWEEPLAGAEYVIGVDVAEGLARPDEPGRQGNLSAAEVFRVGKKPGEWPIQVAELACYQDSVTWAKTLTLLGHYYRKALLAVEITGSGRPTQNALQRVYYYPRLHPWVRWDTYKQRAHYFGWETTPQSKEIMLGIADWLFRTRHVTLRSPWLLKELLNYQEVSPGEYRGIQGDDRVMASFIAFVSYFQHLFPGVPLKELRKTLAQLYGGTRPAEEFGASPDWTPGEAAQREVEQAEADLRSGRWKPRRAAVEADY